MTPKKSTARKSKTNESPNGGKLKVRRETLKDLTPQGQLVKGGNTCGRSR